jgi:hypothetical protein
MKVGSSSTATNVQTKIHQFCLPHKVQATLSSGAWTSGIILYRCLKYHYLMWFPHLQCRCKFNGCISITGVITTKMLLFAWRTASKPVAASQIPVQIVTTFSSAATIVYIFLYFEFYCYFTLFLEYLWCHIIPLLIKLTVCYLIWNATILPKLSYCYWHN